MDLNSKPPFSKGDMKRAGKALMAGEGLDVEKYAEIVAWHQDLIVLIRETCERVIARYQEEYGDSDHLHSISRVFGSDRTKSKDTLTAKLGRIGMSLDSIQDFAGVRYDIEAGLTAQTYLAGRFESAFSDMGASVNVRDYRQDTQQGYRAIHLWLRMPAGRVEIQLRTSLQSRWASLNEFLGDKVGRSIRYEEPQESDFPELFVIIERVRFFSEAIRSIEERREMLLRDLSVQADIADALVLRNLQRSDQETAEILELMAVTSSEIAYLEAKPASQMKEGDDS